MKYRVIFKVTTTVDMSEHAYWNDATVSMKGVRNVIKADSDYCIEDVVVIEEKE